MAEFKFSCLNSGDFRMSINDPFPKLIKNLAISYSTDTGSSAPSSWVAFGTVTFPTGHSTNNCPTSNTERITAGACTHWDGSQHNALCGMEIAAL